MLYEIILPHLAGKPVTVKVAEGHGSCGEYETLQRSGTCYFRCVLVRVTH